ncbi:amidase [candidate division WWE3 bacterium CG10_big_fil_rev_8_21_14_0_10_32_10]|uniref:Amidase n=1 Tax=candidate division WWE3 bacterium CG10_big_fil_rev_8_21_14_0_10_32_10 TaxID=1975090 RepID=A0A2H0R9L3_UNCKA|nr:MAG: amidase [candidate division WWE3 bacterium CG10_big_fil_rev_8_21_14_0_10_32_10]
MEILYSDANTIVQKIKLKEVSCFEVVQEYIDHINRVNPYINALVEDRFKEALFEAQKCDHALKKGNYKGKLFGIPITVKESFDVQGMHTTGGLLQRKGIIASKDSKVVSMLKGEGAIVLGKTNTPTLCLSHRTVNKLYGRTNNPWDLFRTPGGSSGGEGALVAVGGTTLGVGSDFGGSIRFPAHFNGVIGFKSGECQVPSEGHLPPYEDDVQNRMFGIGALSKSVADAELVDAIISNRKPPKKDFAKFKLVVPAYIKNYPVSIETADMMYRVKNFLQGEWEVIDELPPYFGEYVKNWEKVTAIFGAEKMNDYFNEYTPLHFFYLYMREKLFKNTEYDEFALWNMFGLSIIRPREDYRNIKENLDRLKDSVVKYLSNKLLLLPIYATTAPLHGQLYEKFFSIKGYMSNNLDKYFAYVSIANIFGLPSLTVPISTGERGLPIAIQIMGNAGDEYPIFQLGKILEKQFGGYKRCTAYD